METAELVARMRRLGSDLTEVEVKSAAGGLPRTTVETLSAFSNAGGGTLLLGLDERAGFRPAPGFDAPAVRDALAGACADRMEPAIRAPIQVEDFEGSLVLRLDVPELDPRDKPSFVRDRGAYQGSFIRGGDGDRRLNHYEITQLLSNRNQPRHDDEPVTKATYGDLDPELVGDLVRRARRRSPRSFSGLDEVAILTRLGVLTKAAGGPVPTVAGLLTLGIYPQQFFPQVFVSFVSLPGLSIGDTDPEGARFLDNQTIDGPIPVLVADAAAAVRRNMRTAAVIRGLGREDRYDYPLGVVRELIVNAVMHRDYSPESRGMQVQIELYPDRLVVKSPGGLYGGLTAESLGTEEQATTSRNQTLAKLLADVAEVDSGGEPICENRGSGLPSVMSALERAGMSPPVFDAAPGHLFVTVPQHALLSVDTIEWIGRLDQDDLTPPQHLALAMMRSNGRVTNGMLRAWGVDSGTASQALRDLVLRGLATVSGGKRYATYMLDVDSPVVEGDDQANGAQLLPIQQGTSLPPGVEADLDAIVQAVRAGHVTARAIAKALGLSYHTVIRRLRVLRDRNVVRTTRPRNSRSQTYRLVDERDT